MDYDNQQGISPGFPEESDRVRQLVAQFWQGVALASAAVLIGYMAFVADLRVEGPVLQFGWLLLAALTPWAVIAPVLAFYFSPGTSRLRVVGSLLAAGLISLLGIGFGVYVQPGIFLEGMH